MDTKIQQDQLVIDEGKSAKSGLLGKVLNVFKEPPDAVPIADANVIKKTYANWRLWIFISIFLGYTTFYLCKRNIAAALPALGSDLGYTNTQLGLLGSTLYFTYAFGKFTNGIFADRSNVRVFLPVGLMLVAVSNICFAVSSIFITPGKFTFFGLPSATILLWVMAFFWGCNGWFQSMGFPPIAKSLTYWYSNKERATKWCLWSTSHQVGTWISVILSGLLIVNFGWKAAFFIPSIIAITVSIILFISLRDKPTSIGLPDIERYREPEACNVQKEAENKDEADNQSYVEIFKKHVLCNKMIWALAIAYIFVYVIRMGTEDWMIKYLVEAKKDSLGIAAFKLGCLPLFGILGTLMVGVVSDKIFKGNRAPVNIICLIGVIIAIFALMYNPTTPNFIDSIFFALTQKELTQFIPVNGSGLLDFVFIGLIGIFTYGPQVLIGGVCAVESSSKKVASAATGFTGMFGYLGAMISGVGTGIIIDYFGWNGALYFWMVSALICILICLPMMRKKKTCQ